VALLTEHRATGRHRAETGTTAARPSVSWNAPEPGLWVGNRSGEYAGMVEFTNGLYLASGEVGEELGRFGSLDDAFASVATGAQKHRLPEGVLSNVAIISAVIAISIAGMSISMIAA